MRGAYLRELREARGLKAAWVAERAGYSQPHYSKIEAKESIRVEEFVAIMRAMDLRAGDHLENSIEEVKPLMPLVEVLKRFSPNAHERVRQLLTVAASMLEENMLMATAQALVHEADSSAIAYNLRPSPNKDVSPAESTTEIGPHGYVAPASSAARGAVRGLRAGTKRRDPHKRTGAGK